MKEWTSWSEQLEEQAAVIAKLFRTCAFCRVESSFHNPVRQCPACQVPTCRDCLISVSVHNETEDGSVVQACRHAPRRH